MAGIGNPRGAIYFGRNLQRAIAQYESDWSAATNERIYVYGIRQLHGQQLVQSRDYPIKLPSESEHLDICVSFTRLRSGKYHIWHQ